MSSNICQDYFRQYIPDIRDIYVEVRIQNNMSCADVGIYANKNRADSFGLFLEREDVSNRLEELSFERHPTDSGKECHVHGYVTLATDAEEQKESICWMMKSMIEIVEWYIRVDQSGASARPEN